MHYTPQQQQAIDTTDRNLQIIACAGAGKTRVVTTRIINILRQQAPNGLTPENIIAFTFTEKAAAELKDRITRAYQEQFGTIEGIAGMYVGTIHAFCLDLLQRYVPKYLKFDVLDQIKQRLIIDRYYQQCGMGSLGLKRWIESNLYTSILSILRSEPYDPAHLTNPNVEQALHTYTNFLDQRGYLDYDQIMVQGVHALTHDPHVRQQIAGRIRYVTVDEYQDVDPLQERLVQELHNLGANICVVGDDDQNIYQWRGSDVNHILTFQQRYTDVAQVPLETNFRSSPAVIRAARRIVEKNHNRLPKVMQSGEQQTYARGDLLCLTFRDPEQEADWIADKILRMRGAPYTEGDHQRGLSWSDCAILLRSVKNTAAPIVEALRTRDIPYIVRGIAGLFDTAEARAAEAIFQYMIADITADDLRTAWQGADLGLTPAQLQAGIDMLTERRNFQPNRKFSVYSLQRTYLDFLEAIALREEKIPDNRGEIVYYNLGKFSQVISDYEEVHFKSDPKQKYTGFVNFLRYQAPDYYPEGGQDKAYATPDAVQIMTVHQAKGMEFPVVFLPCLQRNRFPAKKQYNRVWKYIDQQAIPNQERYEGSEEDERRLMYVALTRSEKYLFCSWAPTLDNRLYKKPSLFFEELSRDTNFLTREPLAPAPDEIDPTPRRPDLNVELSFSELKYVFECPYQFKLRYLYGFNAPIDEALGYGRSLHNVLADVHRSALNGDIATENDIGDLLDTHFQARYAYPELEQTLRRAAHQSVARYLQENGPDLDKLLYAEEDIELSLPGGVIVRGRVALIKRTDTDETMVVDFKSTQRAQAEDITRRQLHVYALGYEQRFGNRADLIEVHNLDRGSSTRELVDNTMIGQTLTAVQQAGHQIRTNHLPRLTTWCTTCDQCDFVGVCRSS